MWNLQFDKLQPYLQMFGSQPRIAIETGTCRANGTRALARNFARVITIELSRSLYEAARVKLASSDFSHVEWVHGNSGEELPKILKGLPPDEGVFFFLDAHWSGDTTVNWANAKWKGYGIDTAYLTSTSGLGNDSSPSSYPASSPSSYPAGPAQCPLYEELLAITDHCQGPAYILIDDLKNLPVQGPGLKDQEFPGEDWSHLSRDLLLSTVKPRLIKEYVLDEPAQWLLVLGSKNDA